MTPYELKRFITTYTQEVWNEGRVEAMDRYYAADYAHHDPTRPDVTDLETYRGWARELLSGFPDLQVDIDSLVAEEGAAVKRWTAHGTHRGMLAGIAPTGRKISFSGMSQYRLEGEKIVESWYQYDLFGLLQQLGALPAAEAEAAPAPA